MTNEFIAELIQQGGNDELIPILWEKVQTLLFIKADRYYCAFSDTLCRYGYDKQDVRQECYSAMLAAIKWYKPEKGFKFNSYLNYALKHMIRGLYSGKDDALNQAATMYLEQPIGENQDGDTLTLSDTIADDTSTDYYDRAERSDYYAALHEAIDCLPEREQRVLRWHWFDGKTYQEIGQLLGGVTRQQAQATDAKALRLLKSGKIGRRLREIYGDYYRKSNDKYYKPRMHHKSLAEFRITGSSEIEDLVIDKMMYELMNSVRKPEQHNS